MRCTRLKLTLLAVLPLTLPAQRVRIAGTIDRTRVVVLKGNVHPKAQPQFDQGPVDPLFPVDSLSLLLKISPEQQKELDQLLSEQQDPSSPNFHKWLTPEEYADRFGLCHGDMDRIEDWLKSQGLQVFYRARGRNWVGFRGNAQQVEHAFQSPIHRYFVDGEKHYANATDPSIPTALAGVVAGVSGLHDFRPKPAYTSGRTTQSRPLRPNYTSLLNAHYLAPDDIATIYDIGPLYRLGYDGTGQTVAVVGQSDFNPSYVANFRQIFNLSAALPQTKLYGTDPGPTGAEIEAELDLEWVGAVARNATILYYNSTDVFTSVRFAISDNQATVLSMSYGGYDGGCEQNNLSLLDFYRSQAQQAASQGITWVASSGDSGAAGCENHDTSSIATSGLAVWFPASIPEVTAIGGTEFAEGSGSYWSYFNGANEGSALSYIPEIAWNDTWEAPTLAATGGGVSIHYPAPPWQTGPAFLNGYRNVPDVALTASGYHDGYVICDANGTCPPSSWWLSFDLGIGGAAGGTSASAPVFAGILALLNQYLVATGGQPRAGLGSINQRLYWLYQNSPYSTSAFHDVQFGNNVVPCKIGSKDCTTGSLGYYASPGYDRVTGLGSVDANNLFVAWQSLPALRVTMTHAGNLTQGQGGVTYLVTVSNNSLTSTSGTVTVTDTVPAGLTLVSMSGSGWNCSSSTCVRNDVLTRGASYPSITVTVNVAANAPSQVTNQVSASGGGANPAYASDPTTINPGPPATPVLTSPSNGATGVSVTPSLIWSAASGATSYDVYFGTSPTPSFVTNTTGISYIPGMLTAGRTYYWAVVANNSAGNTNSAVWSFTTQTLTTAAITTSPPGLSAVIDGTALIAPQSFQWSPGSQHSISVTSPQGSAGTRYVFANWSDGGNQTHTITTPSTAATYTANFTTQYLLTTTASGSGTITANPSSADGYYNSGTSVQLTANANSGYQFANWSGDLTGTTNPQSVTMSTPRGVTASFTPLSVTSGLYFYPVTPCRIVDTRGNGKTGAFGPPSLAGNSSRAFPIAGSCGIPSTALAYSLNITVVPPGPLTYLTIWPAGQSQPTVSTLNSFNGAVVANAAIVPAGTGGSVSVYVSNTTDAVIDINGYFASPGSGGLAFYPVVPCRVADTRGNGFTGSFGSPTMGGGSTRSFPVPSSSCGIPSSAQAYSMNMTVVPPAPLIYLSTWPTGQPQPVVSTLNSFDGRVVANAAIVPAGTTGAISVYVSNTTDVIIDINGYFAPPGGSGALSFYTATPCRVADTRGNGFTGSFGTPPMAGGATRAFPVPSSSCGIPTTAQAYSMNVTVVPPGPLTYLTAWPTGQPQPTVSTLNSFNGQVVANAAIVPAGQSGSVSVFVTNPTDLILDINGYFAP